jgi:hypothetical protein
MCSDYSTDMSSMLTTTGCDIRCLVMSIPRKRVKVHILMIRRKFIINHCDNYLTCISIWGIIDLIPSSSSFDISTCYTTALTCIFHTPLVIEARVIRYQFIASSLNKMVKLCHTDTTINTNIP